MSPPVSPARDSAAGRMAALRSMLGDDEEEPERIRAPIAMGGGGGGGGLAAAGAARHTKHGGTGPHPRCTSVSRHAAW